MIEPSFGVVGFAAASPTVRIAAGAPIAAAVIVSALLMAIRPPVTRRIVVAWLPWGIAAAALSVYASAAAYPPLVRVAIAGPGAYLLVGALAGIAWLAMLVFGASKRSWPDLGTPLAAIGSGVALALVVGVVAMDGAIEITGISLLVVFPIVAAAVAGVVSLGFWFSDPDAAATGIAGGVVVFGHVLDAMAATLAAASVGGAGSSLLAALAASSATALDIAGRLGVDPTLAWSWLLLWSKLVVAILLVAVVARLARHRPTPRNVVLGGVGLAGVVPGMTTLMLLFTGG